jgi:hypothetical protein
MNRPRILVLVVLALLLADWIWERRRGADLAEVRIEVRDYGAKSDKQAYGQPHDIRIHFLNAKNELLAAAHSVESLGYIMAIDPDPAIGNCRHRQSDASDYESCVEDYFLWAGGWVQQVVAADIFLESCEIQKVPVHGVMRAIDMKFWDWVLSWAGPFYRPHGEFFPRQQVELSMIIDDCAIAKW